MYNLNILIPSSCKVQLNQEKIYNLILRLQAIFWSPYIFLQPKASLISLFQFLLLKKNTFNHLILIDRILYPLPPAVATSFFIT